MKKTSQYKYVETILVEAGTGLSLCDALVTCLHHDKVILSKYKSLQKYCADPPSQHSNNINSKKDPANIYTC